MYFVFESKPICCYFLFETQKELLYDFRCSAHIIQATFMIILVLDKHGQYQLLI